MVAWIIGIRECVLVRVQRYASGGEVETRGDHDTGPARRDGMGQHSFELPFEPCLIGHRGGDPAYPVPIMPP
jgi:hypothetical protein